MIRHPSEADVNSIAARAVNGWWEAWCASLGYWVREDPSDPFSGPDEAFVDPIVSYDDTWCEPHEDFFA